MFNSALKGGWEKHGLHGVKRENPNSQVVKSKFGRFFKLLSYKLNLNLNFLNGFLTVMEKINQFFIPINIT